MTTQVLEIDRERLDRRIEHLRLSLPFTFRLHDDEHSRTEYGSNKFLWNKGNWKIFDILQVRLWNTALWCQDTVWKNSLSKPPVTCFVPASDYSCSYSRRFLFVWTQLFYHSSGFVLSGNVSYLTWRHRFQLSYVFKDVFFFWIIRVVTHGTILRG